MTVLSDRTIRSLCQGERPMLEPFSERAELHGMTYGLSCNGYDIRVREPVDLRPGGFMLASSLERFRMPADVMATVCDKSTLARCGLMVGSTIIECGWEGYLTLELSVRGGCELFLPAGSPICQVVFYRLDQAAEKPYSGKYQDQPAMPVGAR